MAKVSVAMIVSIDGYVADEKGGVDWMFPHVGPEMQEHILGSLRDTDTILVGKATYEGMVATWPQQTNPVADLMNSLPKVVFSTTLEATDWNNTRLVRQDAGDEVRRLRDQARKDLRVLGGARLSQSLAALGLVDEFQLLTVPAVLGGGLPLFDAPMEARLTHTTKLDDSGILSVYRPA